MSAEPIILYTAGALLLSITASRFLLQELITLVVLFKKLKAVIKNPLLSAPSQGLDETHSKRD